MDSNHFQEMREKMKTNNFKLVEITKNIVKKYEFCNTIEGYQ